MKTLSVLLEITVYSGILFAAILLLKRCFKNRMSPFLHFVIWGLLIARLMLPVTLESSVRFFVIPSAGQQSAAQAETEVRTVPIGAAANDEPARIAAPSVPQTGVSAQHQTPLAPAAQKNPAFVQGPSLEQILLTVWLSGVGLGLLYIAALHLLLHRRVRKNAQEPSGKMMELLGEVKAELKITRPVRVIGQCGYGAPAVLFPRTVLMPVSTLLTMNDEQVKFILRHELTHIKRGDPLFLLLLCVLNAVYWFNPIVWIAFRLIRADMETACDSSVIRRFTGAEKSSYAATLLSLFSQKQYGALALGMAKGNTRRIAEKRIRGVFMPSRSSTKVRTVSAVLAAVLLLTCFTTACQPTPETPVVIAKNNGELDRAISGTSPPSQSGSGGDVLYERMNAPKRWQTEQEAANGKLKVVADAEVILPDAAQAPVAAAELRDFSEHDIERVVETLLGGGLTFTETVPYTKEELERIILEAKQSIANQAAGTDNGVTHYEQKDVDYYQNLLSDAPPESALAKKDLMIERLTLGNDMYEPFLGVSVNTTVNGQGYSIRAGNPISPDHVRYINLISGRHGARDVYMEFSGTYLDAPYGVTLTKERASAKAREIAAKLTDELSLCYVAPCATTKSVTERNWGWACVFMREINGFPTAYATEDVGESMESSVQKPVRYEKMVIVLDDQGVTGFSWENPMTITKVENEDVVLKPFEEIAKLGVDRLIQKYGEYGFVTKGDGATVAVSRVELGLMRVARKDGAGYYFLPVWNFFNEVIPVAQKQDKADPPTLADRVDAYGNPVSLITGYPKAWGSVTINAIDGTVINRDLGY